MAGEQHKAAVLHLLIEQANSPGMLVDKCSPTTITLEHLKTDAVRVGDKVNAKIMFFVKV